MARIRAYHEMHELHPYEPPRWLPPDRRYVEERRRPTHSRTGSLIVGWDREGGQWVDIVVYSVTIRVTRDGEQVKRRDDGS